MRFEWDPAKDNMKNSTNEDTMREVYEIKELNPRKNPYAAKLKQQVTMNMKVSTVSYFKKMSEESGVPYQLLINLYLDDCVRKGLRVQFG